MKKLQAGLLCLLLAFCLAAGGCQGTSATPEGSAASKAAQEAESTPAPAEAQVVSQADAPAEETPAVTAEPTATPTPKATKTPIQTPKATKTPTPTPKPKNSLADLEKKLKKMLEGYDGTWSVYCKRLDTDESFCINDSSMVSASLIKLYVFGAAMEAIEEGYLWFDDWSEPLELMIEYSDNDSCNILIDAVGGMDVVNDFIERHGFKDTELYRYMLEQGFVENYTSTKECGELLEQVLNGEYVSEETSELLLYHLKNQYTLYKIPAGVPKDVQTASKSGELDDAQHDAAIVFSPACTYILVVMSNDLEPYFEGADEAIEEIGEISKTVYNYLND